MEHFDVIVVGAGISGVSAARHLNTTCPGKSYAVLEARGAIGGTRDLYRYPGVRSDSDIHTLGFGFKPWTGERSLADGDTILEYVREAARESGLDRRIRFDRVVRVEWSSSESRWTVETERTDTGEKVRLTCGFVWVCSGYFDYDKGYLPEFAGTDRFTGEVVHPHNWPEGLEYAGKRVVVIGSGATAVSLVPALAKDAEHVTMLQRSPSYLFPVPGVDPFAAVHRTDPAAATGLRGEAGGRTSSLARSRFWGSVQALPSGVAAKIHPQGGRAGAARRLRFREAPVAELQPLGAAPVRGPRRRPLQGGQRGAGGDRHRGRDRDLHRVPAWRLEVGPPSFEADWVIGHRNRFRAWVFLSVGAEIVRRTVRRSSSPSHIHLQRDAVPRDSEPGVHDGVRQRLLDAEGRSHGAAYVCRLLNHMDANDLARLRA